MKTQFTRFSVVVSLFLLPTVVTQGASVRPSADPSVNQPASSATNWLEIILGTLDLIYRGLGGDPAKLNLETTLNGKFGVIADQYASSGIPAGLEGPERAALAASVQQAYAMLSAPPPGVVLYADSFLKVLRLIWVDLGLPPEELG